MWLFVLGLGLGQQSKGIAADVVIESVPEGGIQPQVAAAPDGVVHLVYLKGEPRSCDVRYTRRQPGATEWQTPVTVNSEAGSAIAAGTIRGAQMALGKNGSVQVIWNGHGPEGTDWRFQQAPMLYARLEPGAKAFTRQENLLGNTTALDGGASIAASGDGRVYVVWHGLPQGKEGEAERVVFVRASTDNGRTFAPPTALTTDHPGVCPCCSLRAQVSSNGMLSVLYRAATSPMDRGMVWLTVAPGAKGITTPVQEWRVARCPMSSASMALDGKGALRGAWETEDRVFTGILGSDSSTWLPGGPKDTAHPSLAINGQGETLIAMVHGGGMHQAGRLYWRTFDPQGKPANAATGEMLPVSSFPVAYAKADGAFVILK